MNDALPEQPQADEALVEDDVLQAAPAERPPWWARLIGRGGVDDDQRLADLDAAIARAPEAAVNYVLRGELLLKHGAAEPAVADFEQALHLAEAELAASRWGISAQAARDRALTGLRDASR